MQPPVPVKYVCNDDSDLDMHLRVSDSSSDDDEAVMPLRLQKHRPDPFKPSSQNSDSDDPEDSQPLIRPCQVLLIDYMKSKGTASPRNGANTEAGK